MASKRVTIMIDEVLDKKVRQAQAKIIQRTNETTSYSAVISRVLYGKLKLQ
jgi:phosphohistidine swiveling domain-containing protein